MGLIKKIKGSYMFTQFEVGKYTKRRSPSSARDSSMQAGEMRIRPANTEFISEFDRAAEEARQEQQWQQRQQQKRDEEERRQRGLRPGQPRTNSVETLPVSRLEEAHSAAVRQQQRQQSQLGKYKSSMELSASQRDRQQVGTSGGTLPYAALQSPQSSTSQATTAASTPGASPFSGSADQFGTDDQPVPRPRPKGARGARSTMDMQSVYFAPGRNVTMTNQQKQRMSVYPSAADKPMFDKNSASSVDYYVFSPTKQDFLSMPLDARRRARGVVAPEEKPADALHASETRAEAERAAGSSNPFVERRKKAQVMASEGWGSASPFTDPLVGSGRGGVDHSDPRKYLNTPLYANQAGSGGVDLLA
ncbi:hypothetical protein J3B02_005180 [Coemansia erecta]|nr:hypothetical protein J3B02_005180 [Coemansia erecta]